MILQALYQLALRESLVDDLDYEPKPVGFVIRVDDGGRFLGCQSTYSTPQVEEGSRKKPIPRARTFMVPREPPRTSGARAFFFIDKAEYALGIDPDGKRPADKLAVRFELFRQRVEECAAATHDPGAIAVRDFLTRLAEGDPFLLSDEAKANDLFAFAYRGCEELITDRNAVKAHFKGLRGAASEDTVQCLITGNRGPAAELHTQLKNIPGATSSGVPLVSFNARAFESYGWSGNQNAPVSRGAAETYAAALQRLVHPAPPSPGNPDEKLPRRNVRLGDDSLVCYWAAEVGGDKIADLIGDLLDANPDQAGNLFRSIWSGRMPHIDDPSAFYALVLSGAQGRVAVRSWIETTVSQAADNLARWVDDLTAATNTPPAKGQEAPRRPSLKERLRALAPPGKSDVPAPLAAKAIECALRGDPLPIHILARSVQRYRAEIGDQGYAVLMRRDIQAAWIRAVLQRRRRIAKLEKEVSSEMDPNNNRSGYLLGRLMAVLERLQQVAQGDINATVIDRFFSAASATPRIVFTRFGSWSLAVGISPRSGACGGVD